MTETWKPIDGFPHYEVSDEGRIRSIRRKSLDRYYGGIVLKPFVARTTGYMQVDLSGQRRSVHRLVCAAFHGSAPDGFMTNHINGVRCDNRPENLEWVSAAENVADGYRRGRIPHLLGRFGAEHSASKAVESTCRTTGAVTIYAAASDAVREGFDSGAISKCCAGKQKSHKGRNWRFGDAK